MNPIHTKFSSGDLIPKVTASQKKTTLDSTIFDKSEKVKRIQDRIERRALTQEMRQYELQEIKSSSIVRLLKNGDTKRAIGYLKTRNRYSMYPCVSRVLIDALKRGEVDNVLSRLE